MAYYTTYGKFQEQMKDYYMRTGSRMQFPEMMQYMYQHGMLEEYTEQSSAARKKDLIDLDAANMTEAQFNSYVDHLPLHAPLGLAITPDIPEQDMIPKQKDVFVIRHPRYTRPLIHRHDYFEIDYVSSGTCEFRFEDTRRTLHEGEVCIIAPNSRHDLIITDDSTIFCIMIRRSTFNTAFFSLRSGKDLLSYFFRSILQDDRQANYLLFISKNNRELKSFVRGLMIEEAQNDDFSNACMISLVNMIFANLLRNYSKTLQYYDYSMGSDFTLVLQYIQHNYQTLTLSQLAEIFHYSEPHLCTLIKRNTGHNFTDLIKELRLTDAIDYLVNTNEKIGEIAERVGYHSADHFSRVFRSVYHMSPLEYRRQNASEGDFHPFIAESGDHRTQVI